MSQTATAAQTTREQAAESKPAELYEFTIGASVDRYTSHEVDLTSNSELFTAAAIDRGLIEFDHQSAVSRCELQVLQNAEPVLEYINGMPAAKVSVTVWRVFTDNLDERYVMFAGEVIKPTYKAGAAALVCEGKLRAMRQRVPGVMVGHLCNWQLYDSRCGATEVTTNATLTAVEDANTKLTATAFGGQADGYWIHGKVTCGSYQSMVIDHVGNVVTLLNPIPGLVVTNVVGVKPGCDLTLKTCDDKFNNMPNNGSFPYMPNRNVIVYGWGATLSGIGTESDDSLTIGDGTRDRVMLKDGDANTVTLAYGDDFEDGDVNAQWRIESAHGASEDLGKLRLIATQGNASAGWFGQLVARSPFAFVEGDFDIQMEFDLSGTFVTPASGTNQLELRVGGISVEPLTANTHPAMVRVIREKQTGQEGYRFYFDDPRTGASKDTFVVGSESSGMLRLERTGNVFKGSYWNGTAWVVIDSVTSASPNRLRDLQIMIAGEQSIDATMDSLKVLSGINYPGLGFLKFTDVDAGQTVDWASVDWTETIPTGTNIRVRLRAANDTTDLAKAAWSGWVARAQKIRNKTGRYADIQFRLRSSKRLVTPEISAIQPAQVT